MEAEVRGSLGAVVVAVLRWSLPPRTSRRGPQLQLVCKRVGGQAVRAEPPRVGPSGKSCAEGMKNLCFNRLAEGEGGLALPASGGFWHPSCWVQRSTVVPLGISGDKGSNS